MSRTIRQAIALLVFTVLAVAVIAALHGSRTPVVPRPPAAGPGGTALYERIQISLAAATTRNEQALALCESEVNRILAREFDEIKRRGDKAAAEVASYSSCCGIILRLAKDQVFGGNRAASYVDEELGSRLRPTLQTCSRQLDTALARFDRALAESTVTFAGELAQVRGTVSGEPVNVAVELPPGGDLDKALQNLGFNGTAVTVSATLDVWALLNSRLVGGLLTKVTGMAASMFARPAAAAAAEMTVAAADGPLPIGDAIAAVGGLWTAYDIYATRKSFEQELKTTLANAIPDMQRSVHDQVMTQIRGSLDSHRRTQDAIRVASTNDINL